MLKAARETFLREGYAAASMNAIAELAGVSKATLYNHFADKEALFAAVAEDRYREVAASLPAFDSSIDPEAALVDFAKALLKSIRTPEHVALVRLIIGEQSRFPQLSEIFFRVGKAPAYEKAEAYFRELSRRQGYHVPNTRLAAAQFLGAVKEMLYWPILFGGAPLGEDEETIRALAAGAVRAQRAQGAAPAEAPQRSRK